MTLLDTIFEFDIEKICLVMFHFYFEHYAIDDCDIIIVAFEIEN